MRQKRSVLVTYSLVEEGVATEGETTDMLCGGKISLFYDYLGYQGYVYILGAGHVGRAVARHLGELDYHVTMLDHRQEMMTDVEGVDRFIVTQYEEALKADRVPVGAFFLIATPSHAFDYVALHRIFASDWRPRYVGMLASRRKAQALVQQLLEDLGEEVDLGPLHAPVGLDLGGRSPEDIAIAIAAEIQGLKKKKEEKNNRPLKPNKPKPGTRNEPMLLT
jgi:xanthine dehydrogenase accessory factor